MEPTRHVRRLVVAVLVLLACTGEAWATVAPSASVPDASLRGAWALDVIGARAAWTHGVPDGPVVAVIDGGIDLSHPALAGRAWENPAEVPGNGVDDDGNGLVDDTMGWDFLDGDGDPSPGPGEPNGHGTFMAGLVAGAHVGANPGARIMALRVCDRQCPVSRIAAALRYALAEGARVVNMSFGAPQSGATLAAAISEAEAAGVLIVAAAGNAGTDADATPFAPATDASPAILSVTASDAADALAPFANWGPASVDLAAPGDGVVGIVPRTVAPAGYAVMSGTSASAALVSGAASLVAARHPGLGAADVRALLIATARPVPALAGRIVSGGVLDMSAASGGAPVGARMVGALTTDACAASTGAVRMRCRARVALARALARCRRAAPAMRATCRARARARHGRAIGQALDLR